MKGKKLTRVWALAVTMALTAMCAAGCGDKAETPVGEKTDAIQEQTESLKPGLTESVPGDKAEYSRERCV